MQDGDLETLGATAAAAVERAAHTVRGVHAAVANRVFGAIGPAALPVRLVHDRIAALAYGSVELGARSTGTVLQRAGAQLPLIESTRVAAALRAAAGPAFVPVRGAVTLRTEAAEVAPDSLALARAYPDATPKLAVLVHGLGETETVWRGIVEQLHRDTGHTAVLVRYDSGLHVSDNGEQLAHLLEHLVGGWPVEPSDVVLVGHSSGGLVARSAAAHARVAGLRWHAHVRDIFSIGAPHGWGAIERVARVAERALGARPETRPIAQLVAARSAGVQDLRHDSSLVRDWRLRDAARFVRERQREIPFLPQATYHFVGGTPAGPAVHISGGPGGAQLRRIPRGRGPLLRDPRVYERLRKQLGTPSSSLRSLPAGDSERIHRQQDGPRADEDQ